MVDDADGFHSGYQRPRGPRADRHHPALPAGHALSDQALNHEREDPMDKKLIAEARARLYSGVISDVLDGLGNMHHAMAPNVRPLDESLVLFGRARTGLYMPVYHVEPGTNPYEHE